MIRAVLVALLAVSLSGAARAQESDDAKKEELRQHVAKAKVHYDLGEYKEAAEEYILVYRIKPIPALLYNIAQSYRQGGLYEKARQFYKSYLRESPNASNKALIEQNIREMDDLLAKEKRTREAAPRGVKEAPEATLPLPAKGSTVAAQPSKPAEKPAAPAAQPEGGKPAVQVAMTPGWPGGTAPKTPPAVTAPVAPEPKQKPPEHGNRTLALVVGGAGVALLGGGAAFTMKASGIDSELSARPHPTAVVDDLASQSKSNHTLGAVLLGAGVAAAVGAGLLYFVF